MDIDYRGKKQSNLRVRLYYLLGLFAVQLLYFPVNRLVKGGVILSTPWEKFVPFWPAWAVPYLLGIIWWVACFIWAAVSMEDDRFRAFFFGMVFAMLTSYAVYIFFPTYIERPEVVGGGWQMNLIRYIYDHDRLNNAFPSGHAYTTILIVLFWWDWRPRLRIIWMTIALLIILATLFTGQHNIPDPFGGLVWAVMGFIFGWWMVKRRNRK